ncbi:MAG: hypothetical protein ABI900_11365, partial [Betaproteobacteria bacterium]
LRTLGRLSPIRPTERKSEDIWERTLGKLEKEELSRFKLFKLVDREWRRSNIAVGCVSATWAETL